MNNTDKYTDRDWEKLASLISGETTEPTEELNRFRSDDQLNTEKQWNEMGNMRNDRKINVDKAWNNIYSRIQENGLLSDSLRPDNRFFRRAFMRIAAIALVIIGISATFLYLNNTGAFSKKITIAANSNERNLEVSLPDGSKVFLNRNSELSYNKKLGQSTRNVKLKGEAFFDITPDPSKPFIIYAGNATVKVLGTSFSVLTNNVNNAVEVFVKTGSVLLSDNSGKQNLVLEPGFIGTMNSGNSVKSANTNANYLSWNTDLLIYDAQTLDVVFADLKKVYDIDIIADDPDLINMTLTATFDKEPQDTIIRLICTTFNFSFTKDGSVYHLSKR
jgi:transmembrane sensor